METREEKIATWADPSKIDQLPSLRVLQGSISLNPHDSNKSARITDDTIQCNQIAEHLLNGKGDDNIDDDPNRWHFKAISLPRIKPGRLVLSIPKPVFQQIQEAWNLHPRTIEVFLSNNGVFTSFHSPNREQTCLLLKVANSRCIGFDCVSLTSDVSHRTTYVLYHHLESEASIFAMLLSQPQQWIDPHFFVAAVYRSHHQHLEIHRNTIDDAIQALERRTGFGNQGRLMGRRSMDGYHDLADPKTTIQQLSYCQTDLAGIGHVARFSLDCGEDIIRAIDESSDSEPHHGDQQFSETLRAVRMMVRQDVEYTRRRTAMLLSQVQQLRDRCQSQTNFVSTSCHARLHDPTTTHHPSQMLNTITQSDSEYTAAIAVDGKRDSIAMKTIAILGIIFLPGTFVATLFSINMFAWGGEDGEEWTSLTVSPSSWIYWAITVPLTILTFLVWMLWSRRENLKTTQRLMVYRTKPPGDSNSSVESNLVSSGKMV